MTDDIVARVRDILAAEPAALLQRAAEIEVFVRDLVAVTEIEIDPDMLTGEPGTATRYGRAVDLVTAARCAREFLRTQVFLRGVHDSLRSRLDGSRNDHGAETPLRVLYAGTGPFGLLLVPLLPLFTAAEVRATLLDIHPESVAAVQRLIAHLGVEDRIEALECTDIFDWPVPPAAFDVIISETMLAMLRGEPQVAVFRHLVPGLKPSGTLVPQKVALAAWLDGAGPTTEFERLHPLTGMFVLDRDSAEALHQGDEACLQGSITVPDYPDDLKHLVCTTDIQVYGTHRLTWRQCSLNLPYSFTNAAPEPGTRFAWDYQISDRPELLLRYRDRNAPKSAAPGAATDESLAGVPYLRRFWDIISIQKSGRPVALDHEAEFALQSAVFDILGLDLISSLAEIYPCAGERDFTRWLLSKTGGAVSPERCARIRQLVAGTPPAAKGF